MLLVELLEYPYHGPFEKLAYIIPLEHNGIRYSVVYAKFGMRIEYEKGGQPEEVYRLLRKGMKAAKRYYLWRAEQAASTSDLNLTARNVELWDKYEFLRARSTELFAEFEERKEEHVVENWTNDNGPSGMSIRFPAFQHLTEGQWTHETAVDAFFAWSEHALVHIAVLQGKLTTGVEITDLLRKEWAEKCKLVLNLTDADDKVVFDDMCILKSELRNFVAHGSFGKDGAMFAFHSQVGSIPLRVLDNAAQTEFTFGSRSAGNWEQDYERIDRFITQLWSRDRGPAKMYLESGLPTVLTYAVDGTYAEAMRDDEKMTEFVDYLHYEADRHANMDF